MKRDVQTLTKQVEDLERRPVAQGNAVSEKASQKMSTRTDKGPAASERLMKSVQNRLKQAIQDKQAKSKLGSDQ